MSNDDRTCALKAWAVALLAGVALMALLMALGEWRFLPAFFVGLIVLVIGGVFLSRVLCQQTATHGEAPPTKQEAPAAPAKRETEASPASVAAAEPPAPAAEIPTPEAAPSAPAPKAPAAKAKAAEPRSRAAAKPTTAKAEAGKTKAKAEPAGPKKPRALKEPRKGGADDLKKIKGVGPKLEAMLNGMGFYHFDQIAKWTEAEVAWVDGNIEGFKGRVTRDAWVAQARTLAEGGETEFSNRVGKGEVY